MYTPYPRGPYPTPPPLEHTKDYFFIPSKQEQYHHHHHHHDHSKPTTTTISNNNKTKYTPLLHPASIHAFTHAILVYADMLYTWGCMNERAEVLKCLGRIIMMMKEGDGDGGGGEGGIAGLFLFPEHQGPGKSLRVYILI